MNVRICLWTMWETGERRRPNEIVKELGIQYREWQTHPIADQIHLIDVVETTLPNPLPRYMDKFGDDQLAVPKGSGS